VSVTQFQTQNSHNNEQVFSIKVYEKEDWIIVEGKLPDNQRIGKLIDEILRYGLIEDDKWMVNYKLIAKRCNEKPDVVKQAILRDIKGAIKAIKARYSLLGYEVN